MKCTKACKPVLRRTCYVIIQCGIFLRCHNSQDSAHTFSKRVIFALLCTEVSFIKLEQRCRCSSLYRPMFCCHDPARCRPVVYMRWMSPECSYIGYLTRLFYRPKWTQNQNISMFWEIINSYCIFFYLWTSYFWPIKVRFTVFYPHIHAHLHIIWTPQILLFYCILMFCYTFQAKWKFMLLKELEWIRSDKALLNYRCSTYPLRVAYIYKISK